MRLVSFVPPGSAEVRVGALAHDGSRVVDLTAIGLEDAFAAVQRARQLPRIAGHVLHAPGAVAFRRDAVRLLAPLPAARSAHVLVDDGRALPVAGAAPRLRFDDPAPLLGDGDTVTARAGDRWALCVACVVGHDGQGIAESDADAHVAGWAIAARWLGDDAMAVPVLQLGPWLATPDELADVANADGRWPLDACIAVDGEVVARGSWASAPMGAGTLLAQASARHTLRAGDVLTMPLQANGGGWLAVPLSPGHEVRFEVERLGALRARATAGERATVSTRE